MLLGYMTNSGTGVENLQDELRISYSSRKWQSTQHTHTQTQNYGGVLKGYWYQLKELLANAGTIWGIKYWIITQSIK